MNPRRLRLLRINDRADRFWEKDLDDEPGWFEPFVVERGPLSVRRITGTEASQLFWRLLPAGSPPPDLILVDINFESDGRAPLKEAFAQIPTGLLHGLPLLAWSRTSGVLSVLVFHTGDPDAFRSKAPLPMRLLAAELGAVARALAGDGADEPVTRSNMDPAFDWIASHSFSNEKFALKSAVRLYRERLFRAADVPPDAGGLVIDPIGHAALLARVEEAAARTGPIEPDAEGWPGVRVIRSDGSRDSISVQSLFGEVPQLSATMFRPSTGDEPWDLRGGEARIGDYLRGLGTWSEVYEEAGRAAALLPVGEEEPPDGGGLNQLVSRRSHGARVGLVRFLVLLFQVIRQYRQAAAEWGSRYREADWNPAELTFREAAPDRTLAGVLAAIWGRLARMAADLASEQRLARQRSGGAPEPVDPGIHEDELSDELGLKGYPTLPIDSLRFHLALLADLGLVEPVAASRGFWRVRPDRTGFPEGSLPTIPERLAPGWVKPGARETGLRGGLQRTLGFGKEFHPIRRIVAESGVIGFEDPAEFLRALLDEGRCPGWLRELCRGYASGGLGWTEERLWPPFLSKRP